MTGVIERHLDGRSVYPGLFWTVAPRAPHGAV